LFGLPFFFFSPRRAHAMTFWGTITDSRVPRAVPSEHPLPISMPCPAPERRKAEDAVTGISMGIRKAYQRCLFYDIFLVAGKSRFPAHQVVLASASPKLREAVAQARAAAGDQTGQEPELHLPSTCTIEAIGALLDFMYGLSSYQASSEETNTEVLRLATLFELPSLQQAAACWLSQELTVENVIPRLAVCEEFGLKELSEKIKEHLTSKPKYLLQVTQEPEAMKYPEMLQSLLLTIATQGCNSGKREVQQIPEKAGPDAKRARRPVATPVRAQK